MIIELLAGRHYRTKKNEIIRFAHFGQTGAAVFFPEGEYSFQDCFIYEANKWQDHIVEMLEY